MKELTLKMVQYRNNCKGDGVARVHWAKTANEALEMNGLEPISDKKYLSKMHQENYTYEDVVVRQLIKVEMIKRCFMEFHIVTEKGKHVVTFPLEHSAKQWFAKFPELRDRMRLNTPTRP